MQYLYGMILTGAALWAASLALSVLALFWSSRGGAWRPLASVLAAILALVISYFGTARFRFTYRRTVNQSHWGFDSKWFFWFSLALAAGALVAALCSVVAGQARRRRG